MPLTDDEVMTIQMIAGVCDGEPDDVFERNVLPHLADAHVGWIFALAGAFAGHGMPTLARFLSNYAHHIWSAEIGSKRSHPRVFWAAWQVKEAAIEAEVPPF